MKICIALISCLLWSQPLPDTAAAKRLSQWLELFNRGQRAELQQFFETSFAAENADRLERSLNVRQQSGGFDLEKIEESSASRMSALLKERRTDNYVRFTLSVEPEEPHRILAVELRPAGRTTAPAPGARLREEEALAALRKEVDQRAAEGRFAGAVLVAKNGKPVFEQAHGMADGETKIPNRLDTKFLLGSMNKMFIAVAAAQLAKAGKLRFSDPLGKFLPDYPNAAIRQVTIHQLLTHTGGTGDIFGPEFTWANRDKLKTLQDFVKLYGKRGPEFEPGSRWAYSNYGYVLLGVIIEKVSGQSYSDYFRKHIFKPAGMNSTTGGGGYSTVEDLLRFANALLNRKLLDAHHTELVTTGKIDTGRGGRYGYGFVDDAQEGVRWFGHEGGVPGANGDLRIYPESGYVIVVLANLDPPAATEVTAFIGRRLPAK